MITDDELIEKFNYWLEYYTNNGDKHYSDIPEWKIQEIYYDIIVDRVLNETCEEDGCEDELVERINKLT